MGNLRLQESDLVEKLKGRLQAQLFPVLHCEGNLVIGLTGYRACPKREGEVACSSGGKHLLGLGNVVLVVGTVLGRNGWIVLAAPVRRELHRPAPNLES